MTSKYMDRVAVVCGVAFSLLTIALSSAHAQWVPPRGEGSFSLEYHNFNSGAHLWSDQAIARGFRPGSINPTDQTEVSGNILVMSLDYAVYDRVALSVSLPFMRTTHNAGGVYAEGSGNSSRTDLEPNSAFQDLSVGLRYMALTDPLFVTASAGFTWPTHDYPTHGHAAIGRNLRTFSVGGTVGRTLEPVLSGVYLQGGYAYTLSEGVRDIRPNRSNFSVGATYFLTARLLSFSIYWNHQIPHGGIDWAELFFPTNDQFDIHDQITAERFGQLGGAVSHSLTHQLGLYASAYKVIDRVSINTQQSWGFTIGSTRDF